MEKVEKFLETHGLYETNLQILIDHLDNPKYYNPLKTYPVAVVSESVSDYWDVKPTLTVSKNTKSV